MWFRETRVRVYVALAVLAGLLTFPLPFLLDEEYEPSASDGLATASYFVLFTAALCLGFELVWRFVERRRQHLPLRLPAPRSRVVIYAIILLLALYAGFQIGLAIDDCDSSQYECDLSGLVGIGWAFMICVGTLTAIAVFELTLSWSRKRASR